MQRVSMHCPLASPYATWNMPGVKRIGTIGHIVLQDMSGQVSD